MKSKLVKVGISLTILVMSVSVYFLSSTKVPKSSNYPFTLTEIRELAESDLESLPEALNAIHVVTSFVPEFLITSFRGLGRHVFHTYSYQIVYSEKSVIVDAVTDHETAEKILPGSIEHPNRYDVMQRALLEASAIVFTHEHFDHCSGIATSPYLDRIAHKVHFTVDQIPGLGLPDKEASGFTADVVKKFKALEYNRLHRLSPGVVLIKAPSHTPGSQMIYVKLRSGKEFLLVGDIAWDMDNITLPEHHPKFIKLVSGEDEEKNLHVLSWLHEIYNSEPDLSIVVAHDGQQMNEYVRKGWIGDKLYFKDQG